MESGEYEAVSGAALHRNVIAVDWRPTKIGASQGRSRKKRPVLGEDGNYSDITSIARKHLQSKSLTPPGNSKPLTGKESDCSIGKRPAKVAGEIRPRYIQPPKVNPNVQISQSNNKLTKTPVAQIYKVPAKIAPEPQKLEVKAEKVVRKKRHKTNREKTIPLDMRKTDLSANRAMKPFMVPIDTNRIIKEIPKTKKSTDAIVESIPKHGPAKNEPHISFSYKDITESIDQLTQLWKKNTVQERHSEPTESSNLFSDSTLDIGPLNYPYREILPKARKQSLRKILRLDRLIQKKSDKSTRIIQKFPIKKFGCPIIKQSTKPEDSKPKDGRSCSLCKVFHKHPPVKEAPFMEEMRRERQRQELKAYRAKMGHVTTDKTSAKAKKDAMDIHDLGVFSNFTLNDKDVQFGHEKPSTSFLKRRYPSNFFTRKRYHLEEINSNTASEVKRKNWY